MAGSKNILEDVLSYFLARSLSLRFDICTCSRCKQEMIQCLLASFPPVYVDENDPNYKQVERQVARKYSQEMFGEINKAINKVSKNLPHPREEDREQALANLIDKIRQDRGVDFSQYRKSILKRRLALRLVANKAKSYNEYLSVLVANPAEYERLFEALTINVSEFFRDPRVWFTIADVLKQIIEKNNREAQATNLWSAGCAKGEEPYSLAILASQIDNIESPFKIYASDIDKESLRRARAGSYDSMDALRNILKGYFPFELEEYFSFQEGKYYVADRLKALVEFSYLDLTAADYPRDMDMILCRNVFIYFTKPLQEQIVDRFYGSLKEGGYLVIGETENLVPEARLIFQETKHHSRIYRKAKL